LIIEGRVAPNGAIYVGVYIVISSLGIQDSLLLEVDTGADSTLIGERDAEKIGIDYSKLNRGPEALGIGGTSPTYVIPDAIFVFGTEQENWLMVKTMPHLQVTKHKTRNPKLRLKLKRLPSVLGRDILGSRYKINCTGDKATIEI
jgi:hypothetical protein